MHRSSNVEDNDIYGDIPSSNFLDLAFGVENDKYAIELYRVERHGRGRPALRDEPVHSAGSAASQSYGVQSRPRTIGIRFSQDF